MRVVTVAEIVRSRFLAIQAEELGVDAFTPTEIENIEGSWKSARLDLASQVTRARMLWKVKDVSVLLHAHQDLDRAILEVLGESQSDQNAALNTVWTRTNELIEAAISLAYKRVL
jgi:hypothetical protein